MPGIFYDPQLHNWGAAVSQGIMTGLQAVQMGKKIQAENQALKSGEIDLKKKQNLQNAENEIGELVKKYEEETEADKGSEAAPSLASNKLPVVNAPIDNDLQQKLGPTSAPGWGPQADERRASIANAAHVSRSQKLVSDIYRTYLKHGLYDHAKAVEDNLIENIAKRHPSWEVKVNKDGTGAVAYNKTGDKLDVQWLNHPDGLKLLKPKKITIVPEGAAILDENNKPVFKNPKTFKPGSGEGGEGGKVGEDRLKGYEVTAIEKDVQKAFLDQALNNVKDEELKAKITPSNAFNYLTSGQRLTYRGVVRYAQLLKHSNKNMTNTEAVQQSLKFFAGQSNAGEVVATTPQAAAAKPVTKTPQAAAANNVVTIKLPPGAVQGPDGNWYIRDAKAKSGWGIITPNRRKSDAR